MKRFGIILASSIICFSQPVFGARAPRVPPVTLKQIDEQIRLNNYSEALRLCSEYCKQKPDNFDSVKIRIDKIMAIRKRYNSVEGKLIDSSIKGEDADKNYQMVLELEKIEKNPSIIHSAIRSEIKNLNQFKACQKRFQEIINGALELCQAEKYSEALESFRTAEAEKQTAFEIYHEDFIEEFDAETVKKTDSIIGRTNSTISALQSILLECQNSVNVFCGAIEKDSFVEAKNSFVNVQNCFKRYSDKRNEFFDQGYELLALIEENKSQIVTDAGYLPFVSKFILGLESNSESGLLGAADSFFVRKTENMKKKVDEKILANSKLISMDLDKENLFKYPANHTQSRTSLAKCTDYLNLALNVNNLYDNLKTETGSLADNFKEYSDNTLADIESLKSIVTLLDGVKLISQEMNKYENFQTKEDARYVFRNVKLSDSYTVPVLNAVKQLDNIGFQYSSVQNLSMVFSANTKPAGDKAFELVADIVEQAKNAGGDLWNIVGSLYKNGSSELLDEYKNQLAKAQGYLPSLDQAGEDDEGLKQYPGLCLQTIQGLSKLISSDEKLFKTYLNKLDAAESYSSFVQESSKSISNDIKEIAAIKKSIQELEQRAQSQQTKSKVARNEAELRFNQAKQALAKENFDLARASLLKAREKYTESLSLNEDESLRKKSDQELIALGRSIATQENEIVVRDVRNLKNKARNEYYAGNFDGADVLITQAETRWSVTNVNDDAELQNLRAMVNTALSMKTGRVIPASAPLYPEMSQILSLANQYFSEGQKLMRQGNREEASVILAQATQKLNELKLVYPLHQEASLLSLKIDQLLDKQAFNKMFAQKVANARSNYKSSDSLLKQTAYSELVDLYEINPDYPGLKDLIYDVEIELGMRKKPVDDSSLKKSQQLSAQAKKILASAGRDSIKLQQAKELALQALELNSDNTVAVMVLDEVALKSGGQAAVVLSSEDELLYQKAVKELNKNNIIGANTIVQQLLAKKSNRQSAKILELQKKVESAL